jgi:hypothetical protein
MKPLAKDWADYRARVEGAFPQVGKFIRTHNASSNPFFMPLVNNWTMAERG